MEGLPDLFHSLFPIGTELLPNTTEVFELELAFMEFNSIPENDKQKRLAYFKMINGNLTHHFQMYENSQEFINSKFISQTKNQDRFSNGYGVHSLFPYKGKFHPQMIKAIINILKIRPGDKILDPFSGSGTTNIEAADLGIDSYAIDVSPFCQFMIRTKYNSKKINPIIIKNLHINLEEKFTSFKDHNVVMNQINTTVNDQKKYLIQLLYLAYLDSLGFSNRISKPHQFLFNKVVKRYLDTVMKNNNRESHYQYGELTILKNSTSEKINLPDSCIDAIITSPPYSFAIDYINNDALQLSRFGVDISELKKQMIGLKGTKRDEKISNYFLDMEKSISEFYRVLKEGAFLVIVIGSNTDQTNGILLDQKIIEISKDKKFKFHKTIDKSVKGIRNKMITEQIIFLQK